MAAASIGVDKLSDLHDAVWNIYENFEGCDLPTASEKVQEKIKEGIEKGETAIYMTNELKLFSNNEDIDEVATNEIKYMLLPALLGYLTMRNNKNDRYETTQKGKVYFLDYLKLCRSYNVTRILLELDDDDDQKEEKAASRLPDLLGMAQERQNKIERYKQQKQVERELKELKETIGNKHTDDEIKRKYYLTLLNSWVNNSMEELESIRAEIKILESMPKMRVEEKGELVEEEEKPKQQVFRPFIITKNMLQKRVFGAGYPSLPAYSIEEFFQQKVKEKTLSVFGLQARAKDPAKANLLRSREEEDDKKTDVDDPDELWRTRSYDDWKDDHRRGCGNRKNMG